MHSQTEAKRLAEQERQAEQERKNAERIAKVNAMLETMAHWYAVVVPPRKEWITEQILQRLGFSAFIPIEYRYRRVNWRAKVRRHVPYIMTSRYVFVGFASQNVPWRELFSVRDSCGLLIHRVLSSDGEPIAIPPATMRSLFAKSYDEGSRQSAVRLNRSIVSGDRVTIARGPFAGREVVVEGIDKGKVHFVVDLFQRAQWLEMPLDWVEPV